uniref:Uncharacterized protein n=1 Tax=Trypanosoma congolense (strain IL3000) TaxID=1068625 RepID=G0UX55_TRYCI|nr:conserved hypothetical protein [Trypanosoma congolense IL3000]
MIRRIAARQVGGLASPLQMFSKLRWAGTKSSRTMSRKVVKSSSSLSSSTDHSPKRIDVPVVKPGKRTSTSSPTAQRAPKVISTGGGQARQLESRTGSKASRPSSSAEKRKPPLHAHTKQKIKYNKRVAAIAKLWRLRKKRVTKPSSGTGHTSKHALEVKSKRSKSPRR